VAQDNEPRLAQPQATGALKDHSPSQRHGAVLQNRLTGREWQGPMGVWGRKKISRVRGSRLRSNERIGDVDGRE
jgi:hypothetical protein